jgi:hypothetical protein
MQRTFVTRQCRGRRRRADDLNLASQVDRTFDLFDWTGVAPIGEFNIVSPYLWDTSRLYSAGEITFVGVPEPATFVLLILGVVSCCAGRRRTAHD